MGDKDDAENPMQAIAELWYVLKLSLSKNEKGDSDQCIVIFSDLQSAVASSPSFDNHSRKRHAPRKLFHTSEYAALPLTMLCRDDAAWDEKLDKARDSVS